MGKPKRVKRVRLVPPSRQERYQSTEMTAFAVLARTSQYSNRKLRDIAETLALTGILEMTTHTQSGDL